MVLFVISESLFSILLHKFYTKFVFFVLSMTGYQDLDLHHRLVHLARSCTAGQKAGNLHPNVALSAGSYLPNSKDPKSDKTWAKIMNCSEAWLSSYKNWGSMNQANMKVMKQKLAAGQVRRNIVGAKDAKAAEDQLGKKGAAVVTQFRNNLGVGAEFSILRLPRPPAQEVPAQELGAAGPASSAAAATASSSSARTAAASSSLAASVSVAEGAATACKARPVTPERKPAAQPKARPTSGIAGPSFQTKPAAAVILHVYSLGMESLLEGFEKKTHTRIGFFFILKKN